MEQSQPASERRPEPHVRIAKEVSDLLIRQLLPRMPKKTREIAAALTDEAVLMGESGIRTLSRLAASLKRDPDLALKSVRIWIRHARGKSFSTAEAARTFFNTVVQIWYEDHHGMHDAKREDRGDLH